MSGTRRSTHLSTSENSPLTPGRRDQMIRSEQTPVLLSKDRVTTV